MAIAYLLLLFSSTTCSAVKPVIFMQQDIDVQQNSITSFFIYIYIYIYIYCTVCLFICFMSSC